jgi:transposase
VKRDTELTDKEWGLIKPLLPRQRRGRPRSDDRKTLNGILFVLKTGCRWKDVPLEYGKRNTCHNRLLKWQERGVWAKVLRVLLGQLGRRGRLKLSHGILDGSFAPAKKGVVVSVGRAVD